MGVPELGHADSRGEGQGSESSAIMPEQGAGGTREREWCLCAVGAWKGSREKICSSFLVVIRLFSCLFAGLGFSIHWLPVRLFSHLVDWKKTEEEGGWCDGQGATSKIKVSV